MTVFSSGISMYAMARLIQALHVFDGLFNALGLPQQGIFTFSIVLSAVIVLLYIFLGGLTSAIYNEVLQFFLIIAGFLPLVLLGLKNVGGWRGMKASVSAIDPRMAHRVARRDAFEHEPDGRRHHRARHGAWLRAGRRLLVHGFSRDPDGAGLEEHGLGAPRAADRRGSEDGLSVPGDSARTDRDRVADAAHDYGGD